MDDGKDERVAIGERSRGDLAVRAWMVERAHFGGDDRAAIFLLDRVSESVDAGDKWAGDRGRGARADGEGRGFREIQRSTKRQIRADGCDSAGPKAAF